jgi:hypothetical protein
MVLTYLAQRHDKMRLVPLSEHGFDPEGGPGAPPRLGRGGGEAARDGRHLAEAGADPMFVDHLVRDLLVDVDLPKWTEMCQNRNKTWTVFQIHTKPSYSMPCGQPVQGWPLAEHGGKMYKITELN